MFACDVDVPGSTLAASNEPGEVVRVGLDVEWDESHWVSSSVSQ
ncbi:hypothetical protein AKJ09_00087 [Labilithrix luteola]|uniref:Uncharacterized protein n=1 Tax=Labilithrix luteola TaxID=1391654 RepID=A0A0K1PIK9_9BACT|nr:hypothetical protein AKJ09_00019 [Labilithrix luteola]AKU93423.1 hypothetical protein AKJ09_00087 [Labilithrix luteola]